MMESTGFHKWTKNILNELDINPKIVVCAKKAGFVSASSILGASQNELEEKLGLSSFHIKNFTDAVISHVLPKKISGVAYICTESQFPTARLQQMVKHFKVKHSQGPASYTDGIFVHHIPEMDSLVDCVRYQLPSLLSQRPIGLVVLDSVASPFRAEESSMENKNLLYILGYRLHQLAAAYNIAILAINQVTSVIGNNNLYGHSGNVIPTLGLTWANLVTTRLMIGRTDSYVQAEQTEGSKQVNKSSSKTLVEYNVRELEVMFCPWLGRKSCPFVVTSKGIEDVE
ncbi:DNA repair protein XRCC3-like isoform X2 [Portunus trituberculatus]|uniref:DNA repair protein XRCC3-like isoform X2 n=1 Tax=Portunus trituberculatus TaxID=210409 RepID=UPI001E1CB0AF|nr:DNA repair protein XRCC3-like isoform X2 [Portunus trituberculatus]